MPGAAATGAAALGAAAVAGGAAQKKDDEYEYYSDTAPPAASAPPPKEDDEYEYYDEPQDKAEYYNYAFADAYKGGTARTPWSSWAEQRAQRVAAQRSTYLQRHTEALKSASAPQEEMSDESFARQCVRALQDGTRATLLKGSEATSVQLVLSTDGLRLTWTPGGEVRTTDLRSVVYDGAELAPPTAGETHPAHMRFAIVTPYETIRFAITDSQTLQHFVCGLRHIADRPLDRRAFLWQRAAALNRDKVSAASFDTRLNSLAAYLQAQKASLPR